MKQNKDVKDSERRAQKVAEKQNLEKRKNLRDRHYHLVEDEDEYEEDLIESRYANLLKGYK